MERNQAKAYWQKGIFCIRLLKKPSARKFQSVVVGIDPGSKREGYTVATKKSVVLNITTNTPDWVKRNVETRRNLRRTRRQRKTPYRACRPNRAVSKRTGRIPPSTKARWGAKLRVIKFLKSILPLTVACVEDIKAVAKEGKENWNKSFSPLEVGKAWFYEQIKLLKLKLKSIKGLETKERRDARGFTKSKKKLDYIWEAHNVDSHVLCEMACKRKLEPYRGIWKLEFLEFHRRQLHVQNPTKGNIRRQYGSTVSMGMPRGSIIRYKKDNKLYYLGGSSKNAISIHSIETGKRVNQFVKMANIDRKHTSSWRLQFLPHDPKIRGIFTDIKMKYYTTIVMPFRISKDGDHIKKS